MTTIPSGSTPSGSTPSAPAAGRRSVWAHVSWLPRVVLFLVFAGAGLAKLGGDPQMVAMFDVIGAGQGLRYVVGALEIAGAVGVLVPRTAALAALGLALLMIGASVANLTVLGASPVSTVLLLVVAALVVWLRRRRLNPLVPAPGPA